MEHQPEDDADEELELAMQLSRQEFEQQEKERLRIEEMILASQEEHSRREAARELEEVKRLSLAPPPSPFLGLRTSHGNRKDTLRASYVPPSAPRIESLSDDPSAPSIEELYPFDVNAPFGAAIAPLAAEQLVRVAVAAEPPAAAPLAPQAGGRPAHQVALMGAERRFANVGSGTVYLCLVGFEGRELGELVADPSSHFSVTIACEGQTISCKDLKNVNSLFLEVYLTAPSFARDLAGSLQITWTHYLSGLAKAFSANRSRTGSFAIPFAELLQTRNGVRDFQAVDSQSALTLRFAVAECELPDTQVFAMAELDPLRIVTERTVYTAGERVAGTLTLAVHGSAQKIESLVLAVRGGVSSHSSNGSFDFFGTYLQFSNLAAGGVTLGPGVHSFLFSFILPENAPPSGGFLNLPICGVKGSNVIEARATFADRRPLRFAMRELRVVRLASFVYREPEIFSDTKQGTLLHRGDYTVRASAQVGGLVCIGDTVSVHCDLQNNLRKKSVGGCCFLQMTMQGRDGKPLVFRLGREIDIKEVGPGMREYADFGLPIACYEPSKNVVLPDPAVNLASLKITNAGGAVLGQLRYDIVVQFGAAEVKIPLQVSPRLDLEHDPILRQLPLRPDFNHEVNIDEVWRSIESEVARTDLLAAENYWSVDAGIKYCGSVSNYACPENKKAINYAGDGLAKICWAVNRCGRWPEE